MSGVVLQRPSIICRYVRRRKAVVANDTLTDVPLVALLELFKGPAVGAELRKRNLALPHQPSDHRGDAARVHPTAEEEAHRLHTPQPAAHRLPKDFQEVLDVLL